MKKFRKRRTFWAIRLRYTYIYINYILIQEVVEWIASAMDFAYHTIEIGAELLNIYALDCRNEYARGILLCKPALAKIVKRAVLLGCRGEVILLLRREV